jgi:hypothetical protein
MSTCYFAQKNSENQWSCKLGVFPDSEMPSCCDECDRYAGPSRGLGDRVKQVTDALKIKPCGGCNKRRAMLNRASKIARSVAGYEEKRNK